MHSGRGERRIRDWKRDFRRGKRAWVEGGERRDWVDTSVQVFPINR